MQDATKVEKKNHGKKIMDSLERINVTTKELIGKTLEVELLLFGGQDVEKSDKPEDSPMPTGLLELVQVYLNWIEDNISKAGAITNATIRRIVK